MIKYVWKNWIKSFVNDNQILADTETNEIPVNSDFPTPIPITSIIVDTVEAT